MLQVEYTTQFKRDVKLAKKRKNLERPQKIMRQIEHEESLSPLLKDHPLHITGSITENYILNQIGC